MDIPTVENKEISPNTKKQLSVAREVVPIDKLYEIGEKISTSNVLPGAYQNRPDNCFVALDMATRMGCSPLMVMQNLYVVSGKPSWSGACCNALIRSCGRYKDVDVIYVGEPHTESWGAYMKAITKDGREIKGATVTMKIAKAEGWLNKNGSKWQTMPEIMLAYRASAWFARVHCPDILMGLHTVEEVEDYVEVENNEESDPYAKANTN